MKRLYLTLGGVGLVMIAAAAQNQFRIINLGPSPALTTITLDGSDGSVTAVEFYGDGSNLTGVSGSGDVAGPASSTDNAVVRFDGETGKIIQNSAVTIADTTGTIGLPGGILFAERDDHTATPTAGFGELWVRDDTPNVLVFTNDAGTDTVLGAGGGGGDVTGPAGATDNAVPTFSGTGGKTLQNSPVTVAQSTGNMAGVGTLNSHTIPGGTSTLALTGGKLDQFAATTSSELAGVISDETGTGALVFANSPTFTTPALGTPSALTLTNATGLPVGGISATGTADGTTFLRGDGAWAAPSGSGDMILDAEQTVTGAKSFDSGKLILKGATSGTTTINAAAEAGTTTITFPPTTGTVALTGGKLDQFAATTSAELAGIISDETGTGALVFANSPALTTPNLGTPSALTLTNATGLPVGGISATGTPGSGTFLRGDGAWAATGTGDVVGPASATNLAIARFDETTGKLLKNSVVTIADTSGNMAGVGTLNTHTIPGGTGTFALTSNLHDAVTLGGTPDYITISGQVITRALINLGTHVTGNLPLAGLADATQGTILGRAAGAGTGARVDLNGNQVRTITEVVSSLTSTTNSVAWNSENANRFAHTLTENTTMAANSGTARDQQVVMFAITGAASVYTLAWNAEFVAANGLNASIPGPPEVAGDVGQYLFIRINGASKWMLLSHIELTP